MEGTQISGSGARCWKSKVLSKTKTIKFTNSPINFTFVFETSRDAILCCCANSLHCFCGVPSAFRFPRIWTIHTIHFCVQCNRGWNHYSRFFFFLLCVHCPLQMWWFNERMHCYFEIANQLVCLPIFNQPKQNRTFLLCKRKSALIEWITQTNSPEV